MKRFSKIFCVVLIVIVLSGLNWHWPLINIASAETNHEAIIKLCDNNKTKPTVDADDLPPGATVADYDGTCYSKAIDLIFNFYNKHFLDAPIQRTYTFSGPTLSIDGALNLFGICDNVKPEVWAVGCNTYQQTFRNAIPNNTNFDIGSADINAIKAAIDSPKPPIVIADPDAPPDYYPINDNLCNPSYNLFTVGKWPSQFLAQLNCWIVVLIGKIVNAGIHLMGWFLDPSWWGGMSTNPAVKAGFSASVGMVNIIFSVVLVMMAIGTILNLKSYKINDLITKFIVVALLINFTVVIAGSIIDLANYLSLYFLNLTSYSTTGGSMTTAWMAIFSGITNQTPSGWDSSGVLLLTIFINFIVLIAITWAFGSILISLIKRGFMLIFLLIISPFAVIAYLLPNKGMGQWWEKWKQAFLKNTFYGVYVAAGLYLGTIMLQSICKSFVGFGDTNFGFISGMMVSIMASGFLIYLVLLADELAGGSAKAAAEGATKVALGLAAGTVGAGAIRAKTALTTSEGFTNFASKLSSTKGLGWMGKSALQTKEVGLSRREEQGKAESEVINMKPTQSNIDRFNALAASKVTSTKGQREMALIANKLLSEHKYHDLSDDAKKFYAQQVPSIYSDKNLTAGIVTNDLKKKTEDALPTLFVNSNAINKFKKESLSKAGITEDAFNSALVSNNGNFEKAASSLIPTGGSNPEIEKALKKYYDKQRDLFINFKDTCANADANSIINELTGADKNYQFQVVSRLAARPKTLARIIDQVSDSKADTPVIDDFINLIQTYITSGLNGQPQPTYTANEQKYFIENIPKINPLTPKIP